MKMCTLVLFLISVCCNAQTELHLSYEDFSNKYGKCDPRENIVFDLTFIKEYDTSRPVFLHIGNDSCEISRDNSNKLYHVFTELNIDTTINDVVLTAYLCAPIYIDAIEIKKDHITVISAEFEGATIVLPVIEYDYDKPVIYLHSNRDIKIDIELGFSESLSFTYPLYDSLWSINLVGEKIQYNERTYPYLFYEGASTDIASFVDLNYGFVIDSDTLVLFLENTLTTMGFSRNERNDFITYWAPRMLHNHKNYVSFIISEYNTLFPITITPKPDAIMRVFMLWSGVSTSAELNPIPQDIPTFEGGDFTLKEWGGSEIILENHQVMF